MLYQLIFLFLRNLEAKIRPKITAKCSVSKIGKTPLMSSHSPSPKHSLLLVPGKPGLGITGPTGLSLTRDNRLFVWACGFCWRPNRSWMKSVSFQAEPSEFGNPLTYTGSLALGGFPCHQYHHGSGNRQQTGSSFMGTRPPNLISSP